mgnify:CR=1 FL=1
MKTYEGKLVSKSIKVGIVAARFNEFITSKLLSGALDGLLRHEVREDDVHVAWVPGAFEIPLVAAKMAKRKPIPKRLVAAFQVRRTVRKAQNAPSTFTSIVKNGSWYV